MSKPAQALIALILSAGIWFYVTVQSANLIRVFKAPVIVLPESSDYQVLKQSTNEVTVAVRGPQFAIDDLEKNMKQFQINLSGAAGTRRINLNADTLKIPRTVQVTNVEPQFVDVVLDEVDERSIPVKVRTVGDPPTYIKIDKLNHIDRISARGPRSILLDTAFVETVDIDMSSLDFNPYSNRKVVRVPLRPIENISFKTTSLIEVSIEYSVLTEEKTITNISVNVEDGFVAIPSTVKAKVTSLKGLEISSTSIKVYAAADGLDGATGKAKLRVQTGFGILAAQITPAEVQLIKKAG